MKNRHKKKSIWTNKHLRFIIATMLVCSIIYYLPFISGLLGFTGTKAAMWSLHNLYGIDVLGLVFFAPVVYAAYVLGVIPAVMSALVAMVILLPYGVFIDVFPNALFKPTAFVIILSAVGAVVAMLQKSEQEHRQRMKEMKCLYDIGRAAGESHSGDEFMTRVLSILKQTVPMPEATSIKITSRGAVFQSEGFQKSSSRISEDIIVGDEAIGSIEIHSTRDNPYLKKKNHLSKTLAERIGGALRQLELELSLRGYYEQLESEVETRTRDLETIQEKLIRSERLAAVGELASGVGHELRNPLNVIRNCAYLLNMSFDEKGDEESKNTLKVLDKQIDNANKIVTDLMDFTRIKEPSKTRTDINGLIRETLELIAVPEEISVKTGFNGNALNVRTDPEQIGRVFTNIISNAVQAMNGKGKLQIDTGSDDSNVWASFRDNGCGIPEENLEKIFEPLFTTKPKGIGLGLAITRRLVEQNGGQIEVDSRKDEGTSFKIKLPVENRR